MKNVLIISFFWPPKHQSGIWRPMKFAKYLPQNGWRPTVLTAEGSGPDGGICLNDDQIPACEVIRVPRLEERRLARPLSWLAAPLAALCGKNRVWVEKGLTWRMTRWLQWPDSGSSCNRWMLSILQKALEVTAQQHFQAVLVSAPPVHLTIVAALLSTLRRQPVVMDLRDPWTQEFQYTHVGLRRCFDRVVEAASLRRCDRILTVTPQQTLDLCQLYPELGPKIRCITNGFDTEDVAEHTPPAGGARLTVTYSGTSYEDMRDVAAAISLAGERSPEFAQSFVMRRVGPLPSGTDVESMAPIKCIGLVPQTHAVKMMKESTALWFEVPTRGASKYIYPGKTFEYMGMYRPIIGTVPQGAAVQELLKPAGYCRFCHSRDPQQIANLLLDVFHDWKLGRLTLEPNHAYVNQFRRDVLTGQLAGVLNEVCDERTM